MKFRKFFPIRPEGQEAHSCKVSIFYKQHALKGQKLLAQGNALGILAISDAPCKGKSFKIHLIKIENPLRYVKLLPLQGVLFSHKTKTQGAALGYELLPFQGVLLLRTSALQGVVII